MNRPRLFSRGLGFACMILMIFGMVCVPAVASAPLPSDAELLATTQNDTMVSFNPPRPSSSPNEIADITDSTETRLLVVVNSEEHNSIENLNNPATIGIAIVPSIYPPSEESWLNTALSSYGIDLGTCYDLPEAESYTFLNQGVVDAVLLTTHPSPSLSDFIESEELLLLPWSEAAVAAVVVESAPELMIPTQLPANTYSAGQSDAILGYAPLPLGALTPSLDFNQIDSIHDVQIQFTPKRPDVPIRFIVTGANPQSAIVPTNDDGIASYSYQGVNLGRDEINAFADFNENGSWDPDEPQAKSTATKYWVQLGQVTPGGTEFNEVGFDRTVSVNIGIPQADIPVNFASDNRPLSDPSGDMLLGTATTDGNGDAQFTYHSDFHRVDSIYAYIDANKNVNWDDPDEPRSDPPNTVKVWLENSVTGGGEINDADGEVIWSFDGNVSIADNQITGNFRLVDHAGSRPGYTGEIPVSYYCEDFISMNTPGFDLAESPGARHNTIVFTGNFTNDRNDEIVTLSVTIMDLGDPGAGVDMIGVKTGMQPPDPESVAWIGTIPETPTTLPPPPPPPQPIIPEIISSGNFQLHNLVKHHLSSPNAFQKGISLIDWTSFNLPSPGLYLPPGTDRSLLNLAATGANWVGFQVNAGQMTIESTTIFRDSPATATDEELRRVVDLAHSLGMRVMLRAFLGQLYNDPGHWSNHIGTAFTSEDQWQEWFASYRDNINHYATFSQEAGVDMLCIGVEMGGVTHREEEWRRVIQEVRERFKGPITYSSLCKPFASDSFPEMSRIKWWDAMDYIGVTGYYQLTDKNDPTVEELKAAWTEKGHLALMENLSSRFNKPIIITEIGYYSKDGVNRWPAGYGREAPIDLQEQADCYQAALEVLWGKPWLKGIFWFQWDADPSSGGSNSDTFTPYGKPAQEVLKRFYLLQ